MIYNLPRALSLSSRLPTQVLGLIERHNNTEARPLTSDHDITFISFRQQAGYSLNPRRGGGKERRGQAGGVELGVGGGVAGAVQAHGHVGT